MGVAAPIVGLGLSAVSTVAGISEQSKQAKAQQQALQAQIDASRDRLTLAKQQFESTQKYSAFIREREKTLIDAQTQQALQEQAMNEMAQQFQISNTQFQGGMVEQQASQAASNILVGANNEAQQQLNANRTQQNQFEGALNETESTLAQIGTQPLGGTRLANQQNLANAATDEYQRLQSDINSRSRGVEMSLNQAEGSAQYQKQIGALGNQYAQETANLQARLNAEMNPYQRRMIQLQGERNQIASQAASTSMAASANMSYLSNAIAEKANISSLNAQQRMVKSPGVLSYVNAASGLLSQAGGMFARPSSTVNVPSQSGYGFGSPMPAYDNSYANSIPDTSSANFGGFTK